MHLSYICFAALVALASGAVIPEADLHRRQSAEITYQDCDTSQKVLLEADFGEMQALARKAAEHSDSGNDMFKGFFGQEPPGTRIKDSVIKKRFIAISNFKSTPRRHVIIRCKTDNVPACRAPNHILAADRGGPNIYICNSYWFTRKEGLLRKMTAPNRRRYRSLDQYVSVGAQLLHELTHVWFLTGDHNVINPATLGTEKAYSHRNTLLLARQSPENARDNADNYKLFAIASYFDSSYWSVDPDRLRSGQDL